MIVFLALSALRSPFVVVHFSHLLVLLSVFVKKKIGFNSNTQFGGRDRIFSTLSNVVGHLLYSIDSWSKHGHLDCRRFVVKASCCLSLVRAKRV